MRSENIIGTTLASAAPTICNAAPVITEPLEARRLLASASYSGLTSIAADSDMLPSGTTLELPSDTD